jgi:hypothetical protein
MKRSEQSQEGIITTLALVLVLAFTSSYVTPELFKSIPWSNQSTSTKVVDE